MSSSSRLVLCCVNSAFSAAPRMPAAGRALSTGIEAPRAPHPTRCARHPLPFGARGVWSTYDSPRPALDSAPFYPSYAKSQVASALRRLWRMSSDATDFVASPPMQTQLALDLPAPPATAETPLLPVRMANEYVYCPRLAFFEWVDGEWADSGDNEAGRGAHVRVETGGGKRPAPDETEARPDFVARSVMLSSAALGIIAKMDVIEGEGGAVTPIDTKKGKRPHVAEGAYEPERVQICAQALILEEAGYRVEEGAIWYAGSRERVRIALDDDLRARTRAAISGLRLAAAAGRLPPPLVDSPKCTKCSLAGICLPDEGAFFRKGLPPRPLNPAADTALPLYVQEPGARVGKSGEVLVVETEAGKTEVALGDISELVLQGPISLTTPAIAALLREEIPITWASSGGWVLGHTVSTGHRNVSIRIDQYRAAFDGHRSFAFARGLVAAKIKNTRVFLRRNFNAGDEIARDAALDALARLADRAPHVATEAELLGVEGEAAARYFALFPTMLGEAARDFPEFALGEFGKFAGGV